jgi:hypothetical protein
MVASCVRVDEVSVKEGGLSGNWIVLVKQTHHVLCVVGHVLADHERQVATLDHLVVLYGVTDLVPGPVSIGWIRDSVIIPDEHGNGRLFNVRKGNQICVLLLKQVIKVVKVRRPYLEAVAFHVLSVKQHRLDRSSIRLVVHINFKSVLVIGRDIVAHEQVFGCLTQERERAAEEL